MRVKTDDKYISKKYLVYCINSDVCIKQFETNTKGTTRPRVNLNHIRELKLPISPLSEQYRIVTKIEELFKRLDVGIEVLKKTEAQLKLYRRYVLKSACEGKLVPIEAELAKAEGRTYEPADVLFRRILKMRREKSDKNAKYEEPVAPDTSGLPDLPEGWCWAKSRALSWFVTSGSRDWSKYYSDSGAIFIRTQDINKNELSLDNVAFVALPEKVEGKRSLVQKNDILIIITGANVGKVALVDKEISEAYVSQSVALMKLVNPDIAKYIHIAMIGYADEFGKTHLDKMVYGMGRPVLSLENVQEIILPLPPLAEQHRIVKEIEYRLSIADEVKKVVEKSLWQAEGLRQSILQKAFEGELVPQDSNDEPASVLLARIKEERAKNKDLALKRVKIKKEGQQIGKNMEPERGIETQVQLYDILLQSQKSLTPNQLWESSKLDIEEFYAQLKMDVQNGRILEKRPNDTDVFLEAFK